MALSAPPDPYPAGVELFQEGDAAEHVWLIAEGLVLLSRLQSHGDEAVLGLRFRGQIVDQCSHSLNTPHRYSARAISFCRLYRIDARSFRSQESCDPKLAMFVQRMLRIDLRNLGGCVLELKTLSVEQRLCRFLTFLADAQGVGANGGQLRVFVPLRDEELAALVGISPRQLKRVKTNMQERGTLRIVRPHELVLTLPLLSVSQKTAQYERERTK
jgi:CRP-like cAMP-binding protein